MPEYQPDEGPDWDAWNEEAWDDQDLDTPSPRPHPDDRIWRHPAEVAAEARARAAAAQSTGVDVETARDATPPARHEQSLPALPGRGRILVLATSLLLGALVIGGVQMARTDTPATPDLAASPGADGSDVPFAVSSAGSSAVDDEASWTEVVFARVAPGLPRIEIIVGGETSMGGGIVIDDAGHVLTSASFVSGASHIIVWTTDERHVATLVGMDRLTDVAVLSIDVKAQAAALGTDVAVQPGQYALLADASDNAIKLGQITKVRDNAEVAPGRRVHGLIETDLPSESTRPGSAIFDEMGLVIGMTPGGASAGHVLPIDLADRIAREILTFGQASHAMLGIQGLDSEPGAEPGAMVIAVAPGGPAATAGLQPGDLITNVNGFQISSMDDLVSALRTFEPHQYVDALITRDGVIRKARALLGSDTD